MLVLLADGPLATCSGVCKLSFSDYEKELVDLASFF